MAEARFTFGPFVLDSGRASLQREGKPVVLGQRGIALLEALLEADGQIVAKADLMERAWPGTIVEDGNLTVQMAGLRKALGTKPDGQEWIVTAPRAGYRLFRDEVETRAGPSDTRSPLPSLAVLPFENLSSDSEQEYFADGIVEDIITALSRFKSFTVISRNSSFVYKGKTVDVRQVATDLGVRYVLEGSVRRAGGRLRISAQLVEAEMGSHLWARNFDGLIEDVFDVQDRITEEVVGLVEPQVTKAEIERTRRKRPANLDAYELYLQALQDIYLATAQSVSRAVDSLERAVELDPAFAPGLALAGMAYMGRVAMQLEARPDDVACGLAHARAALALGTDDPVVLAHCGYVLVALGRDYDTGVDLLRRAVRENPNNVEVLRRAGTTLLLGGADMDEAAQYYRRALQLNPNEFGTHFILTGLAHVCMAEGRYEEALDWATRSQAVLMSFRANHWMLIAANAYLGRMEEAKRWLAKLELLDPGVSATSILRGQHSKDPRRIDVLIEGMRLAGLPDE